MPCGFATDDRLWFESYQAQHILKRGHDAPFQAMSLCRLMDQIERWAAEQAMTQLLSGKQ